MLRYVGRAVPDDVKEARAAEAQGKKGGQKTLEEVGAKKVEAPTKFTPEGILQRVTEHVVCGYQVWNTAPVRFHLRSD